MRKQEECNKLTPEEAESFTRFFIDALVAVCMSMCLLCGIETLIQTYKWVNGTFLVHPILSVCTSVFVIIALTCSTTMLFDFWLKSAVKDKKGAKR